MSVLELNDIHVVHRRPGRSSVHAVKGVSLSVASGETVGLVGESGCGKSSFARVAAGLEAASSGQALYHGQELKPLGYRRRPEADRGLQMIFQNPYASLSPRRSIEDQLLDGIRPSQGRLDRRREVSRLLELVGLDPAGATKYPAQFSGGQRQRLAIARALAAGPDLLVADEPVTALDAFSSAQIVRLLVSLSRELSMGILFISHDLSLVRAIADRTAVMHDGVIVEEGPSERLWSAPRHDYTKTLIAAVPEISTEKRLPGVTEEEQ
jgi:ABC-type glutathione transport system ATPase component